MKYQVLGFINGICDLQEVITTETFISASSYVNNIADSDFLEYVWSLDYIKLICLDRDDDAFNSSVNLSDLRSHYDECMEVEYFD